MNTIKLVFISFFIILFAKFSEASKKQDYLACINALDSNSMLISQSIFPPELDNNGVVKYSVHSGYRPREMALPAIVHYLKSQPQEKLILVTPGNTLYEGTRHNLGFHFADYLVQNHGFIGVTDEVAKSKDYPKAEQVEITYDDSTARSGDLVFYSEPLIFRTQSGEVFIKQVSSEKLVILVKAIGDYNETGDFVVPFIEAIGASSKNVVMVQDNLKVDKLSIEHEALGPINANGNNAIFSLNRGFAILLLSKLEKLFKSNSTFGSYITNEDWEQFVKGFRELAQDIEKSTAFRNTESVAAPIRSFIKKVIKKRIFKTLRDEITSANKSLRQERGLIIKELKTNKELSAVKRQKLEKELADFDRQNVETFQKEKIDIQNLDQAYADLLQAAEQLIVDEMSYQRVSMGTGAPEDGNNVDFVLGKFDPADYNNDFFYKVYQLLKGLWERP